jgi:ubiquinone/menaquinone biosynthesis C-methylase UbiE
MTLKNSSFIYDSTDIDARYDKARELPPETLRLWADTLVKYVPRDRIDSICDIGCGTGRFSVLLAEHFSANVIGIEPSEKMLFQAKKNIPSKPAILFIKGNTEEIPLLSDTIDMVFLSMVYHHIQDKAKAINEFRRVLRRVGYIAIRSSTLQSLESYPWLQFFPGAMDIEASRAPDRNEIIAFFEDNTCNLIKHAIVKQLFAHDHMQYLSKISARGLSSLKAIPDAEFLRGIKSLEEYCQINYDRAPIFEDIDFYVFSAQT